MMEEICNYFGALTVDNRLFGMNKYNRENYTYSDNLHLNKDD